MTKAAARTDKMTHAARILCIRDMLDSRPFVTIKELQQKFGVSRKTVYNDLDALQEARVPIYSETGPAGEARWMLMPSARKKTITLAAGQVMPLGLARLALSFLEGTDVHDQIGAVMNKLSEGATPATQEHLAALQRKIAIVPHGPKSYKKKADVLNDILTGLLHDQLVEIRYRPPGKKLRKHVLEPLSLMLYREALYLVANSRTFDGMRLSFAVDRITSSTWLRGQRFTYPDDYTPARQHDGAFGLMGGEPEAVEILFDPEQATYVRERRWHPTQEFEPLPDGRVRMTMTASGMNDVFLWLLGHAGTFEVVSPPALREQVAAALEKGVAAHKQKQPFRPGPGRAPRDAGRKGPRVR